MDMMANMMQRMQETITALAERPVNITVQAGAVPGAAVVTPQPRKLKSVPDDDEPIDLEIKEATGGDSSQNFLNSLMALNASSVSESDNGKIRR